MAKQKHTMVPRRAAVLLALLASASDQTLLAALTVGSLNTALVSSASAESCVTSVSPTFANVVNAVSGQPGASVVTDVTPTATVSALGAGTSFNQSPNNVVTSATFTPQSADAVTGITPAAGVPASVMVPAFAFNFPTPAPPQTAPNNPPGTIFAFNSSGDINQPNHGPVQLVAPNTGPPAPHVQLLTAPVLSGSLATGMFLTNATTFSSTTGSAVTSVTPQVIPNVVQGLTVTKSNILTAVTPAFESVVKSVTASNSGASADASSLGCGVNAMANGTSSVAVGTNAAAGTNSVALGQNAQALGVGSTAIGEGASTGRFNNAAAIGNGAVATRDNQMVFGTATNTYTAPGITSAASRAAQSGPLQVVTTDVNGNLASDGGAIFSNINILNSQVARINQNLDQLNHDVKRLDGGVAMAMALGGVYLPEHQRFAIHTDVGFYNGAQALAVQAIARINQTFTANGGVVYDLTGNGGVGGRVGISAGW